MKFWVRWSIDTVVAGVFVRFFFVGLGDHSVSSFNIVLWLGILAVLAVVVGGSLVLKATGRRAAAVVVAPLVAAPATLFALFWIVIIVSNPRWN